ncbi:MAG: ABC transporter ATP-binding protein [Ardenticatenaceae bacterium]|nr:ABC transporter ATP-binding protein [Ardenticatenaceae bacterium]
MKQKDDLSAAIAVQGLTRHFGDLCAVDQLTFTVMPGEIFGFLGPNGAGKTTTIKMLTGQLRPSAGTAKVCGFDVVTDRRQLMPAIGVVFEYQNVYERLTARENLRFSARLYGLKQQRVEELLAQVGLLEAADRQPRHFSHGMKQRLLIARALLHRPRVLFLDEPTKGLDPAVSRDIRHFILDLKQQGVTVFLTTHYMEEAERLCNRVAIINRGQMITLDKPENLKQQTGLEDGSLEDVFLELTGRSLV